MTPKQQRFVEEYLVDLNATQAALRAGYSEKTAYSIGPENLKKPEIAAAIEAAQNKTSEKLDITREWILERLKENAERAMQATQVFDKEGNPTGEYTYQGNVANKALELLGKQQGMFREKVDHNVGGTVRVVFAREGSRRTAG